MLSFTPEDMPESGADPTYRTTIADYFKKTFKNQTPIDAAEISELRWVHSETGWNWLACVRFQDRGHQRTYAFFIKEKSIADSRYAVETDNCDQMAYSPFDLATGAITPAAAGVQKPIY